MSDVMKKTGRPKKVDQWIDGAVADSPAEHQRRKTAARMHRRPIVPKTNILARVEMPIYDVLIDLADRYGVPVTRVLKRFIDDGIKTYGTSEDLKKAFPNLEKDNPFEELPPSPISVEEVVEVANIGCMALTQYALAEPEPLQKQHRPRLPGMSAGQPVPHGVAE